MGQHHPGDRRGLRSRVPRVVLAERRDDAEHEREDCRRENTLGPALLALACRERGVKLLTFSTDLVFDGSRLLPYLESDRVAPLGFYGLTKAEAEPIMRLLADHLPSLDITPMLNDLTGSLTPPGSRCKEGGYRRLDGDIDTAATALHVRSTPGFLHHFTALLSPGLRPPINPPPTAARTPPRTTCTPPGADSANQRLCQQH